MLEPCLRERESRRSRQERACLSTSPQFPGTSPASLAEPAHLENQEEEEKNNRRKKKEFKDNMI